MWGGAFPQGSVQGYLQKCPQENQRGFISDPLNSPSPELGISCFSSQKCYLKSHAFVEDRTVPVSSCEQRLSPKTSQWQQKKEHIQLRLRPESTDKLRNPDGTKLKNGLTVSSLSRANLCIQYRTALFIRHLSSHLNIVFIYQVCLLTIP